MKPKRCKYRVCRELFTPKSPLQPYCCPVCERLAKAERKAKSQKADERKETRSRKEALKTRADFMKEAQTAFNAWVRYRDLSAGHNCICCGKPFGPQKPGGSVDAGHYLSRGSAPHLRLDERNVFAQRKNCNRPGGTTAASFRLGVIARIGLEAVEALEADQEPRKHTIDELKTITAEYKRKLKALKEAT